MIVLLSLLSVSEAADCTVITGVDAYLPEGRAEAVTVIADAGRIVSAGEPPADLPAGAEVQWRGRTCAVVDGTGKVLTAGLVEAWTDLGLVEIELEAQTVDFDAEQDDPIRAALRVSDAYNPRSVAIPVTRMAGVTQAMVIATGGLVSGQAAWVELAGGSQAETVVNPSVAMIASLGATGSRAGDLGLLRQLLSEARLYTRLSAVWQQDLAHPDGVSHRDLEALQRVLRREIPLVVTANRAADIEALIRLAREEEIRLVVHGGSEAWLVAQQLASAKVAVIVDPLVYGSGSYDDVHGRRDNAALLAAAGVPVMMTSESTHNARTLRQAAGNAVRGGLDHDLAIRALTQTPAEVFGLADRGRVAEGMVADLVLWSGDPLELSTRVELVLIGGREIALRSRQTALFEKYRTLPGTPGLPLPP
jgi:imidazolonepropionase-like amidohydrolase